MTLHVAKKGFTWTALLAIMLMIPIGCSSNGSGTDEGSTSINGPAVNPWLSSPIYAITHFDSSQSDVTPYGPPRKVFTVDLASKPICPGGPVNIITLASTDPNYMWQVGTDRVGYVSKAFGGWTPVATFEALADATDNALAPIPDENFLDFGKSTAVGMDVTSMDTYLKSLFGENYSNRMGHGTYNLVDKDNVLYTNFGANLYAFELADPNQPSAGIIIKYVLRNAISAIQGPDVAPSAEIRLAGLGMTYDGHIVVNFTNGVAVVNRDLNADSASFIQYANGELGSNSLSVDENNGIYVASNKTMHKFVWTGTRLSEDENDGAWSSPYNTASEEPPIVKFDTGTGSTPTLMGFGEDSDKLVVITDGQEVMNLVAFWRENIPNDFVQKPGTSSRRVAGQIQVTCGFSPLPDWIQSEQSVVVYGYGAFVVNNIPATVPDEIRNLNKILQVSLMGPAYLTSYGVERFEWDPTTREWSSVWTRSDVSSTSMVPVYSQSQNMAMINGFRDEVGWEVQGLDWDTGVTVHQTIFENQTFGNGAYAILEYFENGDLLFNSICGPIQVHYE